MSTRTTHTSHAAHTQGATAVDPRTLLGNPARMFPTKTPLSLDAVFHTDLQPVPDEPPYPFVDEAGPQDPSQHAANLQCWLDWHVVDYVVTFRAGHANSDPDDDTWQAIANAVGAGVVFTYQGRTWTKGKYTTALP